MKTFHKLQDFAERTKLIEGHMLLHEIEPDSVIGFFHRKRLGELQEFCRSNPSYHIISGIKYSFYLLNRPVEGADLYYLGEGDSDPTIKYIFPISEDLEMALKIAEFQFSS